MILTGVKQENEQNIDLSFTGLSKFAGDDKLCQLGTNGAIGNIIVFMRGKQRVEAPKVKNSDVGWVSKGKEIVWSKFIPYQKVVSSGQDRIYYVTFGAQCLWKTTSFGALGGVKGAWQNHPMKRYRQVILDSCLNKYFQSKSEYWRDSVMGPENIPKLARAIDENEYIEDEHEYDHEFAIVDDIDLMDYNEGLIGDTTMQIVAIALIVLIFACGFGAMCGFIIAMFKKSA